jgi:hypothetical protein
MDRAKRTRSRWKHGCYSIRRPLPGEDEADFKKLCDEVIAELKPSGALECDIVDTIAWLLWRKQNMGIFRAAEQLRIIRDQIIEDACRQRNVNRDGSSAGMPFYPGEAENAAKRKEAEQEGEEKARKQIGQDKYEWLQSEAATVDGLLKVVELEERLNAGISKCIKQLLMLRGVKTLPSC